MNVAGRSHAQDGGLAHGEYLPQVQHHLQELSLRVREAERSYLDLAKPLNLLIVLIVTWRAHRVPCDEIRHVPTQRVAKVAGSTEMDAAEDSSVSDF